MFASKPCALCTQQEFPIKAQTALIKSKATGVLAKSSSKPEIGRKYLSTENTRK